MLDSVLAIYHDGKNHHEAIALVARVAARNLKALLDMKTRSGYSAALTSAADQKMAGRAATSLVRAAEAA